MNSEKIECLLCAEQVDFIGIGECNHEPMCYKCVYKMRVISKNNTCPICKTECKKIMISPTFVPYDKLLEENIIPDNQYGDVFYTNAAAQKAFEKLTEHKCFLKINNKPCPKHDKKFPSIAFLKKHLKEDHHRHLCEICFDKKTCVLSEQKLYTFKQLTKHLERGDIDEFGNVVFMHPFCSFCSKHFFDDEEFRRHINLEHMNCNVCGKNEKLRYYKNYDSLENHYKMSHYICMEKSCLDKKFIAFASADELKLHRAQVHDRNTSKIDIKQLCGFQAEGHNSSDEVIIIKDKQGVDMSGQFLALKKSKNRTLIEADQQHDEIFDIRGFYHCDLDEDEHFQRALEPKNSNKTEKKPKQERESKEETAHDKEKQEKSQQEQPGNQKKKKYVSKKDNPDKVEQSTTNKNPKKQQKPTQVFIENVLVISQSVHFSKLTNEQFDSKLKVLISDEEMKKISDLRTKLFKKKVREDEFMNDFFKILKNRGTLPYNIFPHFIRTIFHEDVKYNLDEEFLILLKNLPASEDNSLIKNSFKYSDFFGKLLKEIEKNIQYRIEEGILSIKKPVKKNKERLYQIMGVVRRLKIEEMAKLKFATNFGLKQDTIDFLQNKVFQKDLKEMQKRLDKIENEEFLDFYVFTKYCLSAIKHADNMFLEKHKIHENILQEFLFMRPKLEEKYGLQKWQLKTVQEKVAYEEQQEEKKYKKQLREMEQKNKSYGYQTKTDYNLVDKGDFPELNVAKKSGDDEKKQANLKEMYQESKSKPATYQKKINELFPTLGDDSNDRVPSKLEPKKSSQQSHPQLTNQKSEEKKEKAWWEKINEKKKNPDEEQEVEVVRVKKGKNKKEKWVSVKPEGLFGR